MGVALFSLPQRGRGTALAVDEEKVYGKLTINKIRIAHNTSSVRRDIIYPTPKPSAHVCHLPQGEGFCLDVAASLPKGKTYVWVRTFYAFPSGEGGVLERWMRCFSRDLFLIRFPTHSQESFVILHKN